MPRASDLSASLRRAEKAQVENKKNKLPTQTTKRKRRDSVPCAANGSISMNESKARRRRLSLGARAQNSADPKNDGEEINNENGQPNRMQQGPTPYAEVSFVGSQRREHMKTPSTFSRYPLYIGYTRRLSRNVVEKCLLLRHGQRRRRSARHNTRRSGRASCFSLLQTKKSSRS